MKRSLVAVVSVVAILGTSSPAHAWDPDSEEWYPEPEPPVQWSVAEPIEPPAGIYLVTETYVEDVVTRSGPATVYSTETVHETTGSYARVLETVATGSRSDFDGAAFNGRAAMGDGRSVAGTYYENYIRTDAGFIPVSVVFFQDDLEIARASHGTTPLVEPARTEPTAPTAAPVAPRGAVTPAIDLPADRTNPPPVGERSEPVAPSRTAPGPLPDRTLEVLRARRIGISFLEPGVVRWRFSGGEVLLLGPAGGDASQRFVGRWDRLPPSGGTWVTRFTLEFVDGTARELTIRVSVRAPGLVE